MMVNGIQLLVDGINGIHIPEIFCRQVLAGIFDGTNPWFGIDSGDLTAVLRGDEDSLAGESWENILTDAHYHDDGDLVELHQDGDLFMICIEKMTEEQYEEVFGK
jgi:hypothetical protein